MIFYKNIITGVFAAVSVFSAVYLPIDCLTENETPYFEPESQSKIEAEALTETKGYTVKEYNGKISVYHDGSNQPLYSLESPYVRDLPKHDRELLAKGIKAETHEEVLIILEDYDG